MAALSPQDRTAIAVALLSALALHGWAIGALAHRPAPRAVDAPAVAARLVAAAPAPAIAGPEAVAAAAVEAPRRTPPVAPRGRTSSHRAPATAPASSEPSEPSSRAAPEARPVPALLALPLRGEGALAYAFVIDGQPGEGTLTFRIEDGRYDLTLQRRAGDRTWPSWHSEGRVGAQGLLPERHRVIRQGRERELLLFDRDAARPTLQVGARAFALSAGTQDRLSWWLQLAAMMAAEPAPHPGLRLRVPVAGPAGVHDWDFEVVERAGNRWLLRRDWSRGPGRAALQWSVWLDGERGFLPVDLRFSLDDEEQWALRLLD